MTDNAIVSTIWENAMAQETTHPSGLNRVEYLKRISPQAADSFRALRKGVMQSGPLDSKTCELILLGSFATAGNEAGLKMHAGNLLKEGVSPDALRQAVMVTLGSTTTLVAAVAALEWIDDLVRHT